MSANAPVLITRAHIGKGPGIVLISFAAPAGDLGKGQVENVEVMRIAMTHATFKEIAALFEHTATELGLVAPMAVAAVDSAPEQRFVRSQRPVSEKN